MTAPQRNAACPCGSGKKYKFCCGKAGGPGAPMPAGPERARGKRAAWTYEPSGYLAGRPLKPDQWPGAVPDEPAGLAITRHAVPPGFLIVQNALDAAFCDALVAECGRVSAVRSTVGSGPAGDAAVNVQSQARTSEFIDIRDLKTDITALVRQMYADYIVPFYGGALEWFEQPEILKYNPGGEYQPHADADNWDAGKAAWTRVKDRDLSMLFYINEGYAGGEIDFPNFGMKLPPKRGMLVAFPSDARYVHAARPVQSGTRFVIVSWAALKGTARVGNGLPTGAIQV